MPSLYPYRVFISHAWRYHDAYSRVLSLLQNARNFEFRNYSVPTDRRYPRMSVSQLTEEIRSQIRPVQVVLVLAGIYVSHSDWIQFEIDFASELRKPIVGIQPWGSTNTPRYVTERAVAVVGWNTDSIVTAIRTHAR